MLGKLFAEQMLLIELQSVDSEVCFSHVFLSGRFLRRREPGSPIVSGPDGL